MSREIFKDWLSKHIVQIVIASVTVAVAVGAMEVTIGTKADKLEVEQLRSVVGKKADRDSVMEALHEIRSSQQEMREGQKAILRYICRKNPTDIGC